MHPLALRLARTGTGVVAACVALAIAPTLPAHAATTAPLPHPVGGFLDNGARVSASTTNQRAGTFSAASLPASVDLRASAPPVGDQGQVGSCVAWTIGYELMGYYAKTTGGAGAPYAPLYLYLRVVAPGGAPNAGLWPGSALTEAQNNGVDTQADYTQGTTNWKVAPTAAEIANAAKYKVTGWTTLWSGDNQGTSAQLAIEQALAGGTPVGIAFPVFQDFEYMAPNTLYNTLSGSSLGGHMVSVFGYDSQGVWIRNHWGTWWGTSGDAHLSWAFVEKLVQGAWTISGVRTPASPSTAPSVTALSPATGDPAGGAQVTISGTGLSGATAVKFGTVPATFTASGTRLVAVAPAHAAGAVDVTVTTAAGTSAVVAADKFTYKVPPPTVTALSVPNASTLGGTSVTVTGTGLAHATAVKVGTSPATGLKLISDTSLQFVAPAHAAGAVDVTVTAASGTSATSTADRLTYVAPPAPAISALSPASGPTYTWTVVTLTGTGLGGITRATAGGAAVPVTRVSDTQVKITLPSHAAGAVPVTVTGPTGTSQASSFTYVAPPAPRVSSISPSSGPSNASTTVTVTGSAFGRATRVLAGTVPVPYTVLSDGQLRVVLPPHAAGVANLQVVTPGGTSPVGTTFTYVTPPRPSVRGLDKVVGLTTGTTTVVLNGENLTDVTRVTAGTVPVTFIKVSATQLRVVLPPHAAATVDLVVTSAAGTSATSAGDRFTWAARLPGTTVFRAF